MHQTEIGDETSALVSENVEGKVGPLDDLHRMARCVHADSHRLYAKFGERFKNDSEPAEFRKAYHSPVPAIEDEQCVSAGGNLCQRSRFAELIGKAELRHHVGHSGRGVLNGKPSEHYE